MAAHPEHQRRPGARGRRARGRGVALRLRPRERAASASSSTVNGRPLALGEIRASRTPTPRRPSSSTATSTSSRPIRSTSGRAPPFEPTIRDEWLYARGVADDKGQLYLLLKAAATLAAEGALPVNVRFACDGEEEIGGHSIVDWIGQDERGADACVIFDAHMPKRDSRRSTSRRAGSATSTSRSGRASATCTRARSAAPRCTPTHALIRTLSGVLAARRAPAGAAAEGVVPPTPEELADWAR